MDQIYQEKTYAALKGSQLETLMWGIIGILLHMGGTQNKNFQGHVGHGISGIVLIECVFVLGPKP